jgi:hypothetical protein
VAVNYSNNFGIEERRKYSELERDRDTFLYILKVSAHNQIGRLELASDIVRWIAGTLFIFGIGLALYGRRVQENG